MQLTSDHEALLRHLMRVFLKENKQINLSALRTEELCWMGNVMDSIAGLADIERVCGNISTVLDIGTGGGFPLLPLAVLRPNWHLTGLDSTQKKLGAIERITKEIGLSNVRLLPGRCEEVGRDKAHREQYDLVTARAVAPLNTLLEFAAPFVKVNGWFVAWKSVNIDTELHDSLLARAEMSLHLEGEVEYDLGGDWGKRLLLFFKKTSPLHNKYPRAIGIPKKDPLK